MATAFIDSKADSPALIATFPADVPLGPTPGTLVVTLAEYQHLHRIAAIAGMIGRGDWHTRHACSRLPSMVRELEEYRHE